MTIENVLNERLTYWKNELIKINNLDRKRIKILQNGKEFQREKHGIASIIWELESIVNENKED